MKRVALALLLGSLGCGGPTPGGGSDAGHDSGFCSDADGGFIAAPPEVCDGIDNDCNGLVDDGPTIQLEPLLFVDADGDGLGDPHQITYNRCLRPGLVRPRLDGRTDCDDTDASAPPGLSPTCDEDGDGYVGAVDCDDADAARHPGATETCNGVDDDCDGLVDDADQNGLHDPAADYGLDEDGDRYPTTVVFACAAPGPAWSATTYTGYIDCAPLDPAIHPGQFDDCASATDANCDGVFTPITVITDLGPAVAQDIAAALVPGTPLDPVKTISIPVGGRTSIGLCTGHYRVRFETGNAYPFFGSGLTVRGYGASPSDVVLDAGGGAVNVSVSDNCGILNDCYGAPYVDLSNLTVQDGHAGCIAAPDVTLDRVILRGCRGDYGGAITASDIALTDTFFIDTAAFQAGGAISFSRSLRMTGGGFTNTVAPAGAGSAISADLRFTNTLDLMGVDLSGITDDIVLTTSGAPILRDLGANATLHCDFATGCTP